MRTPTSRVGYIPCPVACPKLYFAPHKRPFLRRSATRLGWAPLEASQATGAHPLATPPQRPLKAARMGTLNFEPMPKTDMARASPHFFFFTTKCYQRVGWLHPSPAKRRCRCHCGLEIAGNKSWPSMCACDCDLDGDRVQKLVRRPGLAMPLFSFPRILRFERHAVIRPLLWASSQVQLQHLPAG